MVMTPTEVTTLCFSEKHSGRPYAPTAAFRQPNYFRIYYDYSHETVHSELGKSLVCSIRLYLLALPALKWTALLHVCI
jgi:hypothetical protein